MELKDMDQEQIKTVKKKIDSKIDIHRAILENFLVTATSAHYLYEIETDDNSKTHFKNNNNNE